MRVGEFVGWSAVVGMSIWAGSIAIADRVDKPVAVCRPLAWGAELLRDALAAIKPGSFLDATGDSIRVGTARACLAYVGNYLQVTQSSPPQRDGMAR